MTTLVARLRSSIPVEDAAAGARFVWSLPGFLRHPISVAEARATLRSRLDRREPDFLALAKWAIYEHTASPYRQLLRLAGCEYGDLERLVGREGVEGALHTLFRQGVYLTVEEFKGRRPAARGSATVTVDPVRLRNPRLAYHVPIQSSGSGGAPSPTLIALARVRDRAVGTSLVLAARRGVGWRVAIWLVPGSSAVVRLLEFCALGSAPARWFSSIDPAAPGLHPRYRWSARILRWGSLALRAPLPSPRYVPLEDPLPIARWMAEILRTGGTPHLLASTSAVVRLCQAASEAGVDLGGAQFTWGGEPITETRLAVIHRVGAEAQAAYSSTEGGPIGSGCLAPAAPDDVHLLHDVHALIQPGPDGEVDGLRPDALLLSSLRPTAPFILLNVSLGDQATVVERACGCPLERLGWTTHLHTIRSFEKLTAAGMTFLDSDVIPVLDEVLPARFGGGPTDYQLVEEEAEDGRPRLRLLVHPRVGPIDADVVADAFLIAIGGGSAVERVMGLQWREANLLHVERRAPQATPSGKILPLHLGHCAQPLRAPTG